MRTAKRKNTPSLLRRLSVPLFFALYVPWCEAVFHIFTYGNLADMLFPLLLGVFSGLVCAFIVSLFRRRGGRVSSSLIAVGILLLFGTQTVYYRIFKTYLMLFSVFNGAGNALSDFITQTLEAIVACALPLILMLLPVLFICIFGRLFFFERRKGRIWKTAVAAVVSYIVCLAVMLCFGWGLYTPLYYYTDSAASAMCNYKLGIATGTAVDIRCQIFGAPGAKLELPQEGSGLLSQESSSSLSSSSSASAGEEEPTYEPNRENIDFDALLENCDDENVAALHRYFSTLEGTDKNEYTGMFKGYNVIELTAEGFSSLTVSEKYTPTLYKLVNNGFVFENYYNPIWEVSTLDGEYALCTGLYPESGVWSFYRSGLNKNDMRYCLGNALSPLGYSANAYHDHTYSYYERNLSHPNMGYDYKGIGNGLVLEHNVWPNSDLEMMQASVDEYINNERFLAYYMTVSGHLNYNFYGNNMAAKNKDAVADLDMSDEARAYIACNIELDKALEYLISRLEEAGKLEKTLIVMAGDHYPYGLDKETIDELAGHAVESNFELYKSNLIVWSASMNEPVRVEKACSSVDVLPTVLNLLGVTYDSRLLSGSDILSDAPAFVLFNNGSFISDRCMYNAISGSALSLDGQPVSDAYIESGKALVETKRIVATGILENDYYSYID